MVSSADQLSLPLGTHSWSADCTNHNGTVIKVLSIQFNQWYNWCTLTSLCILKRLKSILFIQAYLYPVPNHLGGAYIRLTPVFLYLMGLSEMAETASGLVNSILDAVVFFVCFFFPDTDLLL